MMSDIKYRQAREGDIPKIVELWKVKDWFAAREIGRFEIEVVITNEVSTSFWKKMNFRPYKEICCMAL